MKKKRKKQAVTLIEIMIVILLIGLIGGALAYNMRGSMDKGKAFKTEQNITRIYDILMMEQATTGKDLPEIVADAAGILDKSPLVKDGHNLLRDGWGGVITPTVENDDITFSSTKWDAWKNQHP